jgi:diguanylate cyclase
MRFLTIPSLQLAAIVLIAVVGVAALLANAQSPETLLFIFGLMALGFAGTGLKEFRPQAGDAARQAGAQDSETREARLERELATIAGLIQAHLEASGRYSQALAQADLSLPALATPEKVRAIVGLLIEANEKMQRETSDLSRSLERSRLQVAILRSNLVEAQQIGMRDSLTSLGNRRSFDLNLAKEIAEAQVGGTQMCLVMGDLDHFKKINDNFGHPFGDRVLKHFAELLLKNIKDGAIAARIGGEEFAIILPRISLEDAVQLTDLIRRQLEAQQWMNAQSGQLFSNITASFGIVRLGEKDNEETLLRRADTMLYEAKRAGRNCIICEGAA